MLRQTNPTKQLVISHFHSRRDVVYLVPPPSLEAGLEDAFSVDASIFGRGGRSVSDPRSTIQSVRLQGF